MVGWFSDLSGHSGWGGSILLVRVIVGPPTFKGEERAPFLMQSPRTHARSIGMGVRDTF